jgi:hypothetical protein
VKDDSAQNDLKREEPGKTSNSKPQEGMSQDEINSIADLISGDPPTDLTPDPDDTGRFTR